MSLRRTDLVKQLLVEQKFPAARIEAVGRGERELALATPTTWKNRTTGV